jgi:hypothetical protein
MGLDRLLLSDDGLQVIVRLLALKLPYPLIESVDLVLGSFSNRALGFAVVCALPGELLGREVRDTTRVGACPALFVGLSISRAIVSKGTFWRVCFARRRHGGSSSMSYIPFLDDAGDGDSVEFCARVMSCCCAGFQDPSTIPYQGDYISGSANEYRAYSLLF